MRNTLTKATIVGLTALSLAGSLIATTEPAASTNFRGGGGFHAGGFRGGGFHGGGFRGSGWHGGGWRGGWAGPAIVGGLAAGALLAAPYAYGYGYGGYDGCTSYQPIYDSYGRYIGQQPVNLC